MTPLVRSMALRWLVGAIGFGVGAVVLLTFQVTAAQAASKRTFEETFGSAAQPAFVQPQGIAVDYDTGDLYVIDVGAKTLSRWQADGTPSLFPALGTNVIDGKGVGACTFPPTPSPDCDKTPQQDGLGFSTEVTSRKEFQVAIDESGTATDGNIYLTQKESNLVNIFAADGHYLGQLTKFKPGISAEGAETNFGGPCGVAVDEDGAVYVGDFAQNLVHKYVSQGAPHSPLVNADNVANFAGLDKPCAMAAGAGPSAGFLFVNTSNARDTYKLNSSTGQAIGDPIAPNNESTVSVFPGSGNVFVSNGFNEVKEIDASGAEPVEISFLQATSDRGYAQSKGGNRLYVSRNVPNLEIFGAPLPLPAVVTQAATDVEETAATLNGTLSRQGLTVEACNFEYIANAAYNANQKAKVDPFTGASSPACAESAAEIDAGPEPFSVHADLAGLAAGELFHYRLSATTIAGTVKGNEETFATPVPPTIEDEHASAVTDNEATIRVLINPKFDATSFHVEYGPGSSFALSTPETAVGSDGVAHPLVVSLKGLASGTTYGWRVVADSANGSTESADHSFTTYRAFAPDTDCSNQALRGGPSAVLPDCRAYEMVSPVDKNGDGIVVRANLNNDDDARVQATTDGARITFSSGASFAGQLSSHYYNQYLAARGADGWITDGINAPLAKGRLAIPTERWVTAFTDDLCSMWFWDYNATPLNPDGQEGFRNLYRRQNCVPGIGDFETLTIAAPLNDTVPPLEVTPENYVRNERSVQGFSADGKAAVFVADAKLTDDAADDVGFNRGQVYLRLANDPDLRVVSVLPNGEASEPTGGAGNAVGGGGSHNLQNAVSADGTRVFWSAGLDSVNGSGELYLRLNPAQDETAAKASGDCVPDPVLACTIPVSEGSTATFWQATPSGSAALYSEGGLGGGAASLYRFDVATRARSKLVDKVYGVSGAGEDLERIYVVSGEDRDGGGPAIENQRNLYIYEGGVFTFIAALAADDLALVGGAASVSPRQRATRVTPDGRHIVFQSRAPLTGFDNTEAETVEPAVEVFRYEAGGTLVCVSCNPAGIRPRGDELPRPYRNPLIPLPGSGIRAAAWIPTWEQPLHASRLISEDGNRVFFHSFDALLPRDTNGTVQDVYQWEAPATGSCDTSDGNYFPQNGGCIDLISSGESSERSLFLDADADGSDVFFTTDSSLVPGDPGLIDIYDARVGGGYPSQVTPAICEGEACQSPPPAPQDATPASNTYRGPGNVKPGRKPRCPKDKRRVRRNGKVRCVRKQQRKQKSQQRRADHDRRDVR
jgi:hypothetical protein